jgi:excisionase family DNA binding protein
MGEAMGTVSRIERLWTVEDVSEYLGIPVKTLYQWRYRGQGPSAMRVGRYIRYRADDVRAWVDSLRESA